MHNYAQLCNVQTIPPPRSHALTESKQSCLVWFRIVFNEKWMKWLSAHEHCEGGLGPRFRWRHRRPPSQPALISGRGLSLCLSFVLTVLAFEMKSEKNWWNGETPRIEVAFRFVLSARRWVKMASTGFAAGTQMEAQAMVFWTRIRRLSDSQYTLRIPIHFFPWFAFFAFSGVSLFRKLLRKVPFDQEY